MISLPPTQAIDNRVLNYHKLSTKLGSLSNQQFSALLEKDKPIHSGTGGTSVQLKMDGVNIFIKKIPITDIEREPENILSTSNLFELPLYYQYGIGSAGFGAWRELSAHIMATDWVLKDECASFPLMYHWRVLPDSIPNTLPEGYYLRLMYEHPTTASLNQIKRGELGIFCEGDKLYCKVHNKEKMQITKTDKITPQGIDSEIFDRIIKIMKKGPSKNHLRNCENMREEDKVALFQLTSFCGYTPSKLDRLVQYWGGSSAIRARLEAITKASASLVLCLEYIPETLGKWLERNVVKEGNISESTIAMVERELQKISSFIRSRGLLHFDAHFNNILTDGYRLYLTDFGLATSPAYKLSKVESNFIETHRGYDHLYIRGLWTYILATILFENKNFKAILRQYAKGKGEELTSSLATQILTCDAQSWIMMDTFFKKLKNNLRSGKILNSNPEFTKFISSESILLDVPSL
ncbi:MAG: serine/threonine-protein kinase [Candidatus Paracaedibacteraceae bacterium]|nr:serine/threonine-protein kinase [Candidatus Paracaedibacteraceae bacterium]